MVSAKSSEVTPSKIQTTHTAVPTKRSALDYKNCNIVAQERIWKEHVLKEKNATKSWYCFVCVLIV